LVFAGMLLTNEGSSDAGKRFLWKPILFLVLSLLVVSFSLSGSHASGVDQVTSPLLSKPVTIDGRWTTSDEWSDAFVATMFLGMSSSTYRNGTAYLYAKHDAMNLYFLTDYVSATTLNPASDRVGLQIDPLHNAGNTPQPDDRYMFSTYPSGGGMGNGTGSARWNCCSPLPSGVKIAISMAPSVNLAQPHEITELQVPFSIFSEIQSTIGFGVGALNGSGVAAQLAIWPHKYYIDIPNTYGQLTVSSNPVPEFDGVWPLIVVSLSATLVILRLRFRRCRIP
jgi:hypothetical protein